MTTSTEAAPATAFAVTAWRDHDRSVCRVAGMELGLLEVPSGPVVDGADALFAAGARRVALPRPVDLTGATDPAWDVRALSLVGALTGLAVAVDWQARIADAPEAWVPLGHLHPPRTLSGPPDAEGALRNWRDSFYLCKCAYRQGPGFLQVRDRRRGQLRRFTIDDPGYRRAIATLADGAPAASVPPAVLADLLQEELAIEVGDHVWWAPYQVRRWPMAALVI
ncbi:DUF5825 family protein [Streptomyces albireticuli]|uniref:Uncharacterized protein n=1 Tax=Streptomyces albireticuli TaxID=1940 RepID=A0A2A2DD02_9ACTN|nr:DUF5825 family protein [Streptomyces albireticuli]MCD9144965.1 DUF5825 family protein [Streptomyces albireticuli]MCD9164391.1 DUF5825 family protein [Streptomyces albireticuli]MCD9194102.1 DUF5825 family protein [Streptomyces albireticuli]PAU49394.1 hypothetical protein CK936_08040 [Streptomyces albireticuli]